MERNKQIMRCAWVTKDPLYIKYHDEEWGRPVRDDKILFEYLVLETAQAGLSWLTILKKREGYRQAFYQFDVQKVAMMTDSDVECLICSGNIVRNRLKIKSTISNAKLFINLQREYGSFYNYIQSFFNIKTPVMHNITTLEDIPITSQESYIISRDMAKRGFKFFGPRVCYAFLQAVGFVDDHLNSCFCKNKFNVINSGGKN